MAKSFRDLLVWQRAIQLAVAVYKLTASFPPSEKFGLSFQLRRASVSVASNIAEGYGRMTRGEYLQFLGHARGSNSEVETQLVIVRAINMSIGLEIQGAESLCADVGRLLNALMKSLRAAPEPKL
ncbi:MAG: four helix bundle protein [Acidobacteriaceae bacterium]